MATVNFNYPKFKYTIASTGEPGAGYKLFTYEEGTSTKKTTWTSLAKTAENTNPIVLDANGEADVWIDGNYKFVLAPPTDTDPPTSPVWTVDTVRSTDTSSTSSSLTSGDKPINGSFEIDSDADTVPDNWSVAELSGGTIAVDSSTSMHGAYSLKFTSIGSGAGSASTDEYYEVEKGKQVSLRFDIISAAANTHNTVEIYWYDSSQVFLSSTTVYDDASSNPTSWTRYFFSAVVPATAVYARIVLTGVAADSTTHSTTNFDNIVLGTNYLGKRGALVVAPSTTSTSSGGFTLIPFDSELYDTDAIHDNVTNNSRLTVPSDVTKVRIHCQMVFAANVTGYRGISFHKNGSSTYSGYTRTINSTNTFGDHYIQATSPILEVVEGDYFQVYAFQTSGGALNVYGAGNQTYAQLEIIE